MTEVCGGAKPVHLAEVAARLGIPAKLTCRPDHVSRLMDQGKWSSVKAVCEGDVLTTWAILLRRRVLTSSIPGSFPGAIKLCRFVINTVSRQPLVANFVDWRRALEKDAVATATRECKILCPQLAE